MSQVVAPDITGQTEYFVVTDNVSDWWIEAGTVDAFEDYNAGNYTTYDISMTEEGNTGIYVGTFPSEIPASTTPYNITVKRQLGGSPAENDPITSTGSWVWDGTTLREDSNTSAINNNAQRAIDLAEIAQYLIANSATLTDVIADNSILAKLLATNGDISEFDEATDALQAIRDRGDSAWVTAVGFSTHNAAAVWAVATRVLTANTNLNDLNAAGIRSAVGLASANLDTQLADIPTVAEFEARTILDTAYFDPTSDAVANVTLVDTTTAVTNDVTTDAASRTASKADVSGLATSGALATAQTDLDTLTGADGATLATLQPNYAPNTTTPPTVGEIDTELSSTHGAGNWTTDTGTGTGAWAVTITVDDGSDPIESATVRVTKGAETFVSTTDVNGEVNSGSGFSLDDGTWTVTITQSSFTFTPVTLEVSADTDITYSMTTVSFPASNPSQVTGFLYTYDESGVVESGVTVNLRFRNLAGTGIAFDTAIKTATSDATGLVTFTNLFPGAEYELRRETNGIWRTVTVASDASSPVALPNFWGIDE